MATIGELYDSLYNAQIHVRDAIDNIEENNYDDALHELEGATDDLNAAEATADELDDKYEVYGWDSWQLTAIDNLPECSLGDRMALEELLTNFRKERMLK